MPSPYAETMNADTTDHPRRRSLGLGDPVFQHLADARRLVSHPEIHFDTKQARVMIAACLVIIDQQQQSVHRVDELLWNNAHVLGVRRGFAWGALVGFIVGAFVVFALALGGMLRQP